MNKAISWFEIPATDMERAQKFYETILDVKLNRVAMAGEELAIFPYDRDNGATGGALIHAGTAQPSTDGAIVYLHTEESVDAVLARVAQAGGSVAKGRVELPNGIGAYALVRDTEGNRVGVHALK